MSVLACERTDCDNIMCDRYSYKFGYICDSCFVELGHSGMDVETFMNTPKMVGGKQYNYDEEFELR